MTNFDYDMIVLGGGAAGLTTTAGAAQLGVRVLLVEQEPQLGGDCLHYGCVPSKTLITAARNRHSMANAARWGLPQPELPPVDFSLVADRIRSVIQTIQPHDSPERFTALGAKVRFGQAAFVDEHTVSIAGADKTRMITGKQIVIATGSSASIPNIPGLEEVDYLTNTSIFSLDALPESLVILGAGPIALEMAQSFRRLGSEVTVIQRSGQVLSREDKDMADIVQDALEKEGVRVLLNTAVRSVRRKNGRIEVETEQNGGKPIAVNGTHLLVALGRTPNISTLRLDQAGVEYTPKGITVDARMRTSRKHIFACGDVTGQHLFTHAAGYEGGIVVSNAVFKLPRKADYTWMPWVTYTEPELASIGLNEKAAQEKGLEYTLRTELFASNDRAIAQGATEGCLKMLLDKREKVLGVQIVGPHAGELINEWVAILGGGVKLSTLAGAIHPYPTLGEINKRVAGSLIGEKLFSGKVRSGLCFLFGYQGKCEDDEE